MLAAVASGTILTNILKAGFDRPRPDLVAHETFTYTASFPSGHSMMSAVVYLTIGTLLAQNEKSRKMKIFIMSVAVIMTMLVGISRVYLGAHWASDVLAGWLAGGAWALMFWLAENYLIYRRQRAGQITA
jgi:undecaprenyl-diphosphatase